MRFAYADPPYLGLADAFYGKMHPDAAAFDDVETHRQLVARLVEEFPDGWALSLYSPSLRTILPMTPPDTRVLAWCKPWASWKPGVNPAYSWEPVLLRGGRKHRRNRPHVRDYFLASGPRGTKFRGAKPAALFHWLLMALDADIDDELVDLFPGSGAVTRAFEAYRRQLPLGLDEKTRSLSLELAP